MKSHPITSDAGLDDWLSRTLRARLQSLLAVTPPAFETSGRTSMTTVFRVAIATAAAILALGAGAAFASGEASTMATHGLALGMSTAISHHARGTAAETNSGGVSGTTATNHDAHGDAVSNAAQTCPSPSASDRDAHGDCVSAVAHKRP